MDESEFEGTIVLEQLAEIGKLDDFFEAVDADDVQRAVSLMRQASVEPTDIAIVVKKMQAADGKH